MCNSKKRDTIVKLGAFGWEEIFDPLPVRRDFAGEGDGMSEFLQKESYQAYALAHGMDPRTPDEIRQGGKQRKKKDPIFPWRD